MKNVFALIAVLVVVIGTTFVVDNAAQAHVVSGDANQEWKIIPVHIGAKTPYTSYEAESGTLSGGATVVSLSSPPTTRFSSPQLEASGHAYINLRTNGQSVTWVNNTGKTVTAINVRYSIPDGASGGGSTSTLDLCVTGSFRQALPVTSNQTWVYESASRYDGMSETPSSGYPHVFWDEVHAFISGAGVAPGGKITLRKDVANTAAYYNIDVVDLEAPEAALKQPANSLSITNYGAVANDSSIDSRTAIQNCIKAAEASGKSVWIPRGTFYLNSSTGLTASGISIQGAGMWYSTIYMNEPLPAAAIQSVIVPTSCTLQNFAIDGDAIDQSPTGGNCYGVNVKGSNWVVNSLWIQHEGPGVWADGTNGLVENCRLNNTWADGININNGNGAPGNNAGSNITVINNHVRGSGDDGMAINDGDYPGTQQMSGITLVDNTIVAPWWANNIGIYGGTNDIVANNLVTDSVKEQGIGIGLYGGMAFLKNPRIEGNVILRGGSFGYGNQYAALDIGGPTHSTEIVNPLIRGNTIVNPMFNGIGVGGGTNMVFNNNTVINPLLDGIDIYSFSQGNASFVGDTVRNLHTGASAFSNSASSASFSVR